MPARAALHIGLAATAAVAVARALVWLTPAGLRRDPAHLAGLITRGDPLTSLTAVIAALTWVTAGWLALGALAVLAGRAPGAAGRCARRLAVVVAPLALRRGLELALGLGLASATALPAVAESPAPPPATTSATGWTLDRPAASEPRSPSLDRPATPPAPAQHLAERPPRQLVVTVRPGDSLWAIAARRLGPRAAAGDVAISWPRWYAANRAVVGPDPDLLHPGQQLVPPPTEELP
ncbi:MAG: LysM peptidoglycan-binding domain-containing protein [Frankiaceae bacterium]